MEFDYGSARTDYVSESEKLQQNQRLLYDAEADLGKRDALLEMSHEVQKGSNDKARKALFVAAREVDTEIQGLEKRISGLKESVAIGKVMVHVFDKDMAYCIAVAGNE